MKKMKFSAKMICILFREVGGQRGASSPCQHHFQVCSVYFSESFCLPFEFLDHFRFQDFQLVSLQIFHDPFLTIWFQQMIDLFEHFVRRRRLGGDVWLLIFDKINLDEFVWEQIWSETMRKGMLTTLHIYHTPATRWYETWHTWQRSPVLVLTQSLSSDIILKKVLQGGIQH